MKKLLNSILLFIWLVVISFAQEDFWTRARTKFNQKLYSEAIALLEKELATNPKNDSAWKMLGECYLALKDFSQAEAILTQASRLKSDSVIDRLLKQVNDARHKELATLISLYTDYLTRHPQAFEYRLNLARVYKEYGDLSKAKIEYEIYLTNNPNDTLVEQEYHRTFRLVSYNPKENKMKTNRFEAKNKSPKQSLALARALVSQKKYAPACTLYENYLAKNPNDTIAWREYAQVLSWDKQYDKSIAAYRHLLLLNPNDKKSAFELAQVLSWNEDYAEAIRQYLALDTNDLKVLAGLAETYLWQGNRTRARATYEKILKMDPENSYAKKKLAELQPSAFQKRTQLFTQVNYLWNSEEFYAKKFIANLIVGLSVNTDLELGFGYSQFEQKVDFVTACSYSIHIRERFSESVNGEINYTYNFYDCLDNTHSYGLSVNYILSPAGNINFNYDHHDIIHDVLTTRSLINGIATDNFEASGHYQFEKKYGLGGRYLYGLYSDDNRQQNLQAQLFYKLFSILSIGYGYNLITYSLPSFYYWSPDFYQTHALWFELTNGSNTPLSYYVRGEIGKITNTTKLARSLVANFVFLPPATNFRFGLEFAYSELSRTTLSPSYWQQSLTVYLNLKL